MQIEVFTVCREFRASLPSTDILGIHHHIETAGLPVRLAGSHLLLCVRYVGEEADPHEIQIRFIDDDGNPAAPVIRRALTRNDPGRKQEIQNAISVTKLGDYWFDLFLDGAHTHRLPFSVEPA
jgi:hypothetical protein